MSRHIRLALFCALALVLGCLLPTHAQNPDIPSLRPSVVAPFMANAPSIDGVITDGELTTSHVQQFVAKSPGGKGLLQARDGEFWLGGTKEALYIAVNWEDAADTQTAASGSFAVGAIKAHDFRIFVIRKKP